MTRAAPHAGKLAVITGAASGIGFELAKNSARNGMDLLIVADGPEIHQAAQCLSGFGAGKVQALVAELYTNTGVDELIAAVCGRPVHHLIANPGRGLAHPFQDQDRKDASFVVNTDVSGTVYLIHRIARDMRDRGEGRILITGSRAGVMPGSHQAIYNGTNALLDSFSSALRQELRDSGVTVTCLMLGLTGTQLFERANMSEAKEGSVDEKLKANIIADKGYHAMLAGEDQVFVG